MKKITNWRKATVADIEADGLLREATKIHVLCCRLTDGVNVSISGEDSERIKKFFNHHIESKIPVVMHNGICFDIPLVEKLLNIDLSELMLIDTLAVSWYLNHKRLRHGLGSFHEDYGIEKPEVTDWENLTYEEYKHRCAEDVKINYRLWEDLSKRLISLYTKAQSEIDSGSVGGKRISESEVLYIDRYVNDSVDNAIERLLTFLMFKMDCAALQEKTGWDIDEELLQKGITELSELSVLSKAELESVMPEVPIYTLKKKPKAPFKKDGSLSASGLSWKVTTENLNSKEVDSKGNLLVKSTENKDEVKILKGYEPANGNSPEQIKNFLFSLGWIPQTFKYIKDQEAFDKWIESKPKEGSYRGAWSDWKKAKPVDRAVPQITIQGEDGKELCPSLEDLAEEVPEVKVYSKFCVIKHRLGVLKGFERDLYEGKLCGRINGFTNTLRVQHKELVNLVGVDKPYGELIRGCLVAPEGKVLIGSDMSSLEDRTKHHFMLPYDPEYVSTMQEPDFDPHILMALEAELITKQEFQNFKLKIIPAHVKAARRIGKTTNYASVYNAGPPKIALAAGITLEQGVRLHKAYWDLNWSVKAIADDQVVIKDIYGDSWLINPVNGFCYSLRKESDRFSTLCQGTGSFFFDMWVSNILDKQLELFRKKSLTGSFHDENIQCVKNSEKLINTFTGILKDSIVKVNKDFYLRRDLGCDVQIGQRYSEIH